MLFSFCCYTYDTHGMFRLCSCGRPKPSAGTRHDAQTLPSALILPSLSAPPVISPLPPHNIPLTPQAQAISASPLQHVVRAISHLTHSMLNMEVKLNLLGVRAGADCAGYCVAAGVVDCVSVHILMDVVGGLEVG